VLWSLIGHSNPELPSDLRNSSRHPTPSSAIAHCGISVRCLTVPRCLGRVRWNRTHISPPYHFNQPISVDFHSDNYGGGCPSPIPAPLGESGRALHSHLDLPSHSWCVCSPVLQRQHHFRSCCLFYPSPTPTTHDQPCHAVATVDEEGS
jgi:hypothetical protein